MSDYVSGTMPVDGHKKTFTGFAKTSSFSAAFIIVVLLMPILVICAQLAWLPSLIATFVIGLLIAKPLQLGGGWYATLTALGVFGFILCLAISALAG